MWIAAVAVVLALAGPVADEVSIESDDAEVRDGKVVRYIGNVIVNYQDLHVEADWVIYDDSTQDLTAGDSIHFTRGAEDLEGDRLSMNLGTKTGSITNARGKVDPGFYVTAREATRLPDGRYEFLDVRTTACEPDCESWLFRSRRMTLTPGKSFSASKTIFRFRNVPLFYFPYFSIPTEGRTRSSGFLIPSTGSSTTRGRSFRESFYYAINRSADATITGEYFTKRGPTGAFDFRARPREDTSITISTLFAKDKLGAGGRRATILATSSVGGFRSLLEMNVVSSLAFRQVYEEGFNQISSPIQRAQGFMARNGDRATQSAQKHLRNACTKAHPYISSHVHMVCSAFRNCHEERPCEPQKQTGTELDGSE
jgi:LPS-assembly protein